MELLQQEDQAHQDFKQNYPVNEDGFVFPTSFQSSPTLMPPSQYSQQMADSQMAPTCKT